MPLLINSRACGCWENPNTTMQIHIEARDVRDWCEMVLAHRCLLSNHPHSSLFAGQPLNAPELLVQPHGCDSEKHVTVSFNGQSKISGLSLCAFIQINVHTDRLGIKPHRPSQWHTSVLCGSLLYTWKHIPISCTEACHGHSGGCALRTQTLTSPRKAQERFISTPILYNKQITE